MRHQAHDVEFEVERILARRNGVASDKKNMARAALRIALGELRLEFQRTKDAA